MHQFRDRRIEQNVWQETDLSPCTKNHKTDMAMEVTKSKKQLTVGISEALPQSAVQLSRHMKKQRLTTSLLSNSELPVMV